MRGAVPLAWFRQMKQILYLTPRMPWPLESGMQQRQYRILQALSQVGEVHVVSLSAETDRFPHAIRPLCHRGAVQTVEKSRLKARSGGFQRGWNLLRECAGFPEERRRIPSGALAGEVKEILRSSYDLTWVARLQTAWMLGVPGGDRAVLDLDDVEHRKKLRELRTGERTGRQELRAFLEARAWRLAEFRTVSRFRHVLVCSEKDRQYLAHVSVAVLPNGITLDQDEKFNNGVAGRMIYVGRMSYRPNVDAVQFFCRAVLPLIRRCAPDAHLQIIGAAAPLEVLSLHDGQAVQVIGRVDEIAEHVRAAQIEVVPIRYAGGTRIKILEALSLKTPVVSTTIGAEGLNLIDGEHITLGDSAEEFASACVRLLRDENARRALAEAGHAQVRVHYQWSRIQKRVVEVAQEVLEPRQQV